MWWTTAPLTDPDQSNTLREKNDNGHPLTGRFPKEIILSLKESRLSDDDIINICTKGSPLTNTTRHNHLGSNTPPPPLSSCHSTNNNSPPYSYPVLIYPNPIF